LKDLNLLLLASILASNLSWLVSILARISALISLRLASALAWLVFYFFSVGSYFSQQVCQQLFHLHSMAV
jgi:hypothetical protein